MQRTPESKDRIVFCTDGSLLVNDRDEYSTYAEYLEAIGARDAERMASHLQSVLNAFTHNPATVVTDDAALHLLDEHKQPVLSVYAETGRAPVASSVGKQLHVRRAWKLLRYVDVFDDDSGPDVIDEELGVFDSQRKLVESVLRELLALRVDRTHKAS